MGKEMCCRMSPNYHGQTIVPTFLFQQILFVKDQQPRLTLSVVYISHFEDKLFKRWYKRFSRKMNILIMLRMIQQSRRKLFFYIYRTFTDIVPEELKIINVIDCNTLCSTSTLHLSQKLKLLLKNLC